MTIYTSELILGKLYMTPYPALLNHHRIETNKPKINSYDTLMFVEEKECDGYITYSFICGTNLLTFRNKKNSKITGSAVFEDLFYEIKNT